MKRVCVYKCVKMESGGDDTLHDVHAVQYNVEVHVQAEAKSFVEQIERPREFTRVPMYTYIQQS